MHNKYYLLAALGILLSGFNSCKENNKQSENPDTVAQTTEEEAPKTYAEISIKKGGEWNTDTREYMNGEFENIETLDVPSEHTDHSWYIRYEGPGWENKQIAYRLYLDWRNAIDIFGKKVDTLVLPYVGQDNFDSYHNEAPWGQDILKAGQSLGIGGYGRFTGDTIAHFDQVANTHVDILNSEGKSTVAIDYKDWKTGDFSTDLNADISIFPEDRFLKATLTTSAAMEGLATGIVKFDGIPLMQKTSESGKWSYIATYGAQTLAGENDKLGMALFYKTENAEITDGPHDHLLVFDPSTEGHTYYILSAWEQEPDGIASQEAFITDLDQKLRKLDQDDQLEQ